MTLEPEPDKPEQKGIQSVEIASRVLNALVQVGGETSLKWLCADTGLSPSRIHAYLVSLRRAGLVEQNPVSGQYHLGLLARQIGLAAIDQRDQYDILLAATQRLRDETGRTTNLAIWSERGPTVAHWARGRESLTLLVMNSGLNPPLLTTAMGRIFLAYLPDGETRKLVRREKAALSGSDIFPSLQTDGAIDKLKSDIREQGYCVVKGILSPFISAIAAPLLDTNGYVVAVLSVLGREIDVDGGRGKAVLDALQRATRRIEAELDA